MIDKKEKVLLQNNNLFTVNDWPHSYPPQGTLRYLIFHSETNGFKKVIKRIGRRILLDEKAFFQWVEEQNK